MDALFGLLGVLLLLASLVSIVIFGILSAIRKNDNTKNYKGKLKNSAILFVVSIVLIIIGVNLPSGDDSGKKETASTSNKSEVKKEKKPVAYSYDKADIKANKKGGFAVAIEVKDGYTPEITDGENATLKKNDDTHYILSGAVDKNEQTATYNLSFTSTDDKQTKKLTIDNAIAKEAYVQKQIAQAEKKEKAKKAAAKKKIKTTALNNENKLSYGMLNKSQDKYVGEPYHITKGHVMQAMEDNGETTLLVEVSNKGYGLWDDIIAVYYPKSTDAIDDDFVEIWGTLGEKWDYTTKIGGSNSVPTLQADSIKVIGHME